MVDVKVALCAAGRAGFLGMVHVVPVPGISVRSLVAPSWGPLFFVVVFSPGCPHDSVRARA